MHSKIQAVRIDITRAEGPPELCDRTKSFSGPDCWDNANVWLRGQSHTFPADGGYDKHAFRVAFADGYIYTGRIDCKASTCQGSDLDLAAHVRNSILFSAGLRRPPNLTQERYDELLRDANLVGGANAFMIAYAIPGADPVLLAGAFRAGLSEYLGAATLQEMDRLNREETDARICHSHDFCDANMVMWDAFVAAMGREPDLSSDADIALMSEAWEHMLADAKRIEPYSASAAP